jgi:hypothetical protein
LKDSYLSAKYKWVPSGSFPNNNLGKITTARIDHIFVSKSTNVLRYGILNNFYFTVEDKSVVDLEQLKSSDLKNKKIAINAPSDHYPVSIFSEFPNNKSVDTNETKTNNNDSIKNKILKKIFK